MSSKRILNRASNNRLHSPNKRSLILTRETSQNKVVKETPRKNPSKINRQPLSKLRRANPERMRSIRKKRILRRILF